MNENTAYGNTTVTVTQLSADDVDEQFVVCRWTQQVKCEAVTVTLTITD